MTPSYQRWVLASRPQGRVTADNFRLENLPIPTIKEGEVLVRNHYVSLDPYMRARMDDVKSYAAAQVLGETMIAGTVGVVLESKNSQYIAGDTVLAHLGWAEIGVSDGHLMRKIDVSKIPMSAYLGALGMPGMAAWYGVTQILHLTSGDTVLVSAASGAVGSVVGQLCKQRGCRVIGIAGGSEKCAYVVQDLGFDVCIDYRSNNWREQLKQATSDGVDGLFENVGGAVFDAGVARMNAFGRIALCGLIAGYDGQPIPFKNMRYVLARRLSLQGFIVTEHMEYWPQGLAELTALFHAGKLDYRESIAHGLASAPEAFIGLLSGKNFGKQLVKLV